jgi:hypothetical protein
MPRSYDVKQLILDTAQHITFAFTVWFLPWRRVQCVTPKRRYLPTPIRGVICQTIPTLKTEAACPFEIKVTEYQTTRCHETTTASWISLIRLLNIAHLLWRGGLLWLRGSHLWSCEILVIWSSKITSCRPVKLQTFRTTRYGLISHKTWIFI